MPATALDRVSYAAYLELEATSDIRHEHIDGVVLAMAYTLLSERAIDAESAVAPG